MQPERICGHEYTIRSDVWSTGITLLELVQNRFPFPNDLGAIELMMYITTGEVRVSIRRFKHLYGTMSFSHLGLKMNQKTVFSGVPT